MKRYLTIEVNKDTTRLPSGKHLFYECKLCNSEVESVPEYASVCKCRNILIDTEAGRQAFKDITQVAVFEKVTD